MLILKSSEHCLLLLALLNAICRTESEWFALWQGCTLETRCILVSEWWRGALLKHICQKKLFCPCCPLVNSSSIKEALKVLMETSRTAVGRRDLASKSISTVILHPTREFWQHLSGDTSSMSSCGDLYVVDIRSFLCTEETVAKSFFFPVPSLALCHRAFCKCLQFEFCNWGWLPWMDRIQFHLSMPVPVNTGPCSQQLIAWLSCAYAVEWGYLELHLSHNLKTTQEFSYYFPFWEKEIQHKATFSVDSSHMLPACESHASPVH